MTFQLLKFVVQKDRDVFELNLRVTMSWRIRSSEHDGLRSEDTTAMINFELPRLSLRIVRLEASHIGGKLAREDKAADMNNRTELSKRAT